MHLNKSRSQQSGFSLVEVMVSIVLMAVGILGVTSMQVSSIKVNQGAFNQSQANILMTEILDRMRLNRTAYLAGSYDNADTAGAVPAVQACINDAAGCTGVQLALHDIREFSGFFNDVNNLQADFVPFIPGGSATIVRDAVTNVATVVVSWQQEEWTKVQNDMVKSLVAQQLTISVKI